MCWNAAVDVTVSSSMAGIFVHFIGPGQLTSDICNEKETLQLLVSSVGSVQGKVFACRQKKTIKRPAFQRLGSWARAIRRQL